MNDALCQMYYAKSGLARFVYRRLTSVINKSLEKGKPNLNLLFSYFVTFLKALLLMFLPDVFRGMEVVSNAEWLWPNIPVSLFGVDFNLAQHLIWSNNKPMRTLNNMSPKELLAEKLAA